MRLKITFQHDQGILLPWDYQYAVQQWVYKILEAADRDLATHLHDIGYVYEGKSFKLFNFGPWTCFPYKPNGNKGIWFNNPNSSLSVSFLLPEQLSTFVSGLFKDQSHTFYFKGKISIPISTVQIELLPEPTFVNGLVRYQLVTGARISVHKPDHAHAQYIGPEHEDYDYYFVQNLVNKHRSSLLYKGEADKEYTISMQVFEPIKTQKINVPKDGKVIEMKGYKFGFELNAPAEIHRTLYYAGAGEECSLGMGWVERETKIN
jgi:CRISPR-associated endoribonuclease Cas6